MTLLKKYCFVLFYFVFQSISGTFILKSQPISKTFFLALFSGFVIHGTGVFNQFLNRGGICCLYLLFQFCDCSFLCDFFSTLSSSSLLLLRKFSIISLVLWLTYIFVYPLFKDTFQLLLIFNGVFLAEAKRNSWPCSGKHFSEHPKDIQFLG